MMLDITYDSPIDVMYMIHHALRAEAAEATPRLARQLGTGDTLATFAQMLHRWASTLEEHARIEDTYMTPLLPARPIVQDNEAEHRRLTTLFHELKSFLQALRPRRPSRRAGNARYWVRSSPSVSSMTTIWKVKRISSCHSSGSGSEDQQCALVWRLLCDGESQEAGTIRPWIIAALTTAEQQVLATLLARWEGCHASCPHRSREEKSRLWRGTVSGGESSGVMADNTREREPCRNLYNS